MIGGTLHWVNKDCFSIIIKNGGKDVCQPYRIYKFDRCQFMTKHFCNKAIIFATYSHAMESVETTKVSL